MMGGIGTWQLLVIVIIVVLLFGTKKLRNIGSDLGSAVKGFKKSLEEDDSTSQPPSSADKKDDQQK